MYRLHNNLSVFGIRETEKNTWNKADVSYTGYIDAVLHLQIFCNPTVRSLFICIKPLSLCVYCMCVAAHNLNWTPNTAVYIISTEYFTYLYNVSSIWQSKYLKSQRERYSWALLMTQCPHVSSRLSAKDPELSDIIFRCDESM